MRFGERMRRQRRDKNMRAADVADRIGVSQPTITKWENGTAVPDRQHFRAIARFLEVSDADVVQLIFNPEPDADELGERVSQLEAQMALALGRLDQLAGKWPDGPPGDPAQP